MGQNLSRPAEEQTKWPKSDEAPQTVQLPFDIPSSPYKTKVISLGDYIDTHRQPVVFWYIEGGLKRFAIPPGYTAECIVYDQIHVTMTVIHEDASKPPQFVLKISRNGMDAEYSGYTPTAPFAKVALVQKRLDILNGLEAFGFLDPKIQIALRQKSHALFSREIDTPPVQLQQQQRENKTFWTQQIESYQQKQSTFPDMIAKALVDSQQQQHRDVGPSSSLPSLQTWLNVPTATSTPSIAPLLHDISLTSTPVKHATPMHRPPQPPQQQQQPLVLPPLPQSHLKTTPEAHAAAISSRPPSRSRRTPTGVDRSGLAGTGKGWTAFTAFGLEVRNKIRDLNPAAPPTEIEKLVGQLWAQSSAEEKKHWIDVAAEVRRSSSAMGRAVVGEESSEKRVASDVIGGGNVAQLKRTKSDAATVDERQLRPKRKPRFSYTDQPYEFTPPHIIGGQEKEKEEMTELQRDIEYMEAAIREQEETRMMMEKKSEQVGAESDALSVLVDMQEGDVEHAAGNDDGGRDVPVSRGEPERTSSV